MGKVRTSWGVAVLAVPAECATWLFAVPNFTFGAVKLVLLIGVSGEW